MMKTANVTVRTQVNTVGTKRIILNLTADKGELHL